MLAADTVVGLGRRILPKADDRGGSARAASSCSPAAGTACDRRSRCALPDGRVRQGLVRNAPSRFQRLTPAQIEDYLAGGEWHGKAGGYAIQGRAECFVRFLSGSHSNVVGLPLFETAQLLRGVGLAPAVRIVASRSSRRGPGGAPRRG